MKCYAKNQAAGEACFKRPQQRTGKKRVAMQEKAPTKELAQFPPFPCLHATLESAADAFCG